MTKVIKKHSINQKQRILFTILVLIIPLLNFSVFTIGMNGKMFISSFYAAQSTSEDTVDIFVGFHNYAVLFDNLTDMTGNKAIPFVILKNTIQIIPVSIITTCISLIMSYAIARKFLGHRFFKIILYTPAILSTVVLSVVFKKTCETTGIINRLFGKNLGALGVLDPKYVWKVVLGYTFWTGCIVNLYFMSSFARLPKSVFESAELDGANELTLFIKIAFPMVSSLFVTLLLSSICGAFGFFGPVYFLTDATNKDAHTIGYLLVMFSQNSGAAGGRVGLYAALGVVVTIIGSIVAILTRWVGSKLAIEDLEY